MSGRCSVQQVCGAVCTQVVGGGGGGLLHLASMGAGFGGVGLLTGGP